MPILLLILSRWTDDDAYADVYADDDAVTPISTIVPRTYIFFLQPGPGPSEDDDEDDEGDNEGEENFEMRNMEMFFLKRKIGNTLWNIKIFFCRREKFKYLFRNPFVKRERWKYLEELSWVHAGNITFEFSNLKCFHEGLC